MNTLKDCLAAGLSESRGNILYYPNEKRNEVEFSNFLLNKRPVIYLDYDGVINFFNSIRGYKQNPETFGNLSSGAVASSLGYGLKSHTYQLNWSQELLKKLGELDVDIVWLSTWRQDTELLEKVMDWDTPAGWLAWGESDGAGGWGNTPNNYGSSAGKMEAIIADQSFNPRPFIWIDDEAIKHYFIKKDRADILRSFAPHLTVVPNPEFGIVKPDFEAIVKFIEVLKSFNTND